jgi:hypothetical protein
MRESERTRRERELAAEMRGERMWTRRALQEIGRPDATATLLQEVGRLHTENVKLRSRVRELERSRERWRTEAKAWKWLKRQHAQRPTQR